MIVRGFSLLKNRTGAVIPSTSACLHFLFISGTHVNGIETTDVSGCREAGGAEE